MLPNLPEPAKAAVPPGPSEFWSVDSVFAFENMGFTKSLNDHASSLSCTDTPALNTDRIEGKRFLCCANCDLGPLGVSILLVPSQKWIYLIDAARVKKSSSYESLQ